MNNSSTTSKIQKQRKLIKECLPAECRISTLGTSDEEQLAQVCVMSLELLHQQGKGCHQQHELCVSTLKKQRQHNRISSTSTLFPDAAQFLHNHT